MPVAAASRCLRRLRQGWIGVATTAAVFALTAAQFADAAGKPTLNLSFSGLVNGKTVSGKVQFGTLICAPSGTALQLVWNGDVKLGSTLQQVSGDMSFSNTGRSTFGPHGSAIASLVVAGKYSARLASGVQGGSGTATVASNRKSGTINVRLIAGASKVQETGSWTCG